jgi:hypothetical protein
MSRRLRAGALAATVVASMAVPCAVGPAAAQQPAEAGYSIHAVITGGKHPGTYDVARPDDCRAGYQGDGTWMVNYDDATETPSGFSASVGGYDDAVQVTFGGSNEDGYLVVAMVLPFSVDDRGDTATLVIPAADGMSMPMDLLGATDSTVEVTIECHSIDRFGAVKVFGPLPTPQIQGPPPDGATTIRVTLDSGPYAGTWDAWTSEPACSVTPSGAWRVRFNDWSVLPSRVAIIGLAPTAGSSSGVATIRFGSPGAGMAYTSGPATFTVDDRAAAATITIRSDDAHALPLDQTAAATLDIAVECATVQR